MVIAPERFDLLKETFWLELICSLWSDSDKTSDCHPTQITSIRSSSSANLPLTYIKSMSDSRRWRLFPLQWQSCLFLADSSCHTSLCLWQTHFIWRLPFSLNMNPEPIFPGYGWRLIQIGLVKRWCISQGDSVSSLYFSLSRYRLCVLPMSVMMDYWRRLVWRCKWPLGSHTGLEHKQRHT